MKRELHWAVLFACLLALGCSSKPDAATETDSQAPATAAAPTDASENSANRSTHEYHFDATIIDGNLEKPPVASDAPQAPETPKLDFSTFGAAGSPSGIGGGGGGGGGGSSYGALPPRMAQPRIAPRMAAPSFAPAPEQPTEVEPAAPLEEYPANPLRSMSMARSAPLPPSTSPPAGGSAPPSLERYPQSADAYPAADVPLAPESAIPESAPAAMAPPPYDAAAEMQRRIAEESRRASSAMGARMDAAPELPSMAAPAADIPAAAPPVPIPASVNEPFDVVRVFYGTDRLGIEPLAETWPQRAARFTATAISLLSALVFVVAAMCVPGFRWSLAALAVCGLVATAGFGYRAVSATIQMARQSAKEGMRYGVERSAGGRVELGVCEVTIPKTHQTGELEAPSIMKLEVSEDAKKHVVLRKTERLETDAYYKLLRERVEQSPRKELFVFIHGFNTSFEDAARRTAQMAHDLPFAGAPIFYSWPANEMYLLSYAADETNVAWTVPHLKQFLLSVVAESNAQSINLIAHSMGNRALTAALRELELEFKQDARLFNQVVLAAPDIDAADFRDNIAPAIRGTARRVTLYASSGDQALAASQLVHRYPRAGDTRPELVVAEGLDTIDVSLVGSSPWGHSYYGSSDPILRDLAMLLSESLPPDRRMGLASAEHGGRMYWIFQAGAGLPDSTARQPTAEALLTAPR